jgi:hypothetical protein
VTAPTTTGTLPLFVQAPDGSAPVRIPALDARYQLGAMLAPDPGRAGNPRPGALPLGAGQRGQLTVNGDGTVSIAPFVAVLPGQSVTQASYICGLRQTMTIPHPDYAPAGQFVRYDYYAVAQDHLYDGSGYYEPKIVVVAGAAAATAASASAGPAPTGGLWCGWLIMSNSAVDSVSSIGMAATVAAGGIRPVRDASDAAAAGTYAGQYRHHWANGLERWDPASGTWTGLVVPSLTSRGPVSGTAGAFTSLRVNAGGQISLTGNTHLVQVGPDMVDPTVTYRQRIEDPDEVMWRTWDPALNNGAGGWRYMGATLHALFLELDAQSAAGVNDVRLTGTQGLRADNAVQKYWLDGPVCRVRRAAAAGVATGSWTTIAWDVRDHDSDGMWSTGTNVVAKRAGFHRILAGGGIGPSSGGRRGVRVLRNGAVTTIGTLSAPGNTAADVGATVGGTFFLAVGDVLVMQMYQDSGASQNTGTTDFSYPFLDVAWDRS